jgi:hypothetical protein
MYFVPLAPTVPLPEKPLRPVEVTVKLRETLDAAL